MESKNRGFGELNSIRVLEFIGVQWKIRTKVNDTIYKLKSNKMEIIDVITEKHNPSVKEVLDGGTNSISEKDMIKVTIKYRTIEEDI